jgi:hypothetical protein
MVSYEDPQSPQTATHCLRLLKLSRDGIKSVQVVSTYLLPYRPVSIRHTLVVAITLLEICYLSDYLRAWQA